MRKIYFFYLALFLNVPLVQGDSSLPPATYEELASWLPTGECIDVTNTIAITQEDGRTGYASGGVYSYTSSSNRFHGGADMQFSDRTRIVNTLNPNYTQNFDRYLGATDAIKFIFKKTATNQFQLQLTLVRWGAQFNVNLTKAPQAKLYTGWGPTIGNGSGRALYTYSINRAWSGECIN